MRISDVLMEAADRLEGRWAACPIPSQGETCAALAIQEVEPRAWAAHDFVSTTLGLRDHGMVLRPLVAWNDEQTNVADVQHALRYAALVAASEGK